MGKFDESSTPPGQVHGDAIYAAPLLQEIEAQAAAADETQSIAASVITALKQNDIMRLSASAEIAGLGGSIVDIANELRAIATACTSTGWCMWNHLCTFHHFVGLLGPTRRDFLSDIVAKREWVCFPAGATTNVIGTVVGDTTILKGVAAFGSGARYAEWAGVVYEDAQDHTPRFALVDLSAPGIRIEETWEAMAVRASATDHVRYDDVRISAADSVAWPPKYREPFRDPGYAMIHPRYREDWVALSVVWLGAMATGLAERSLVDTTESIRDRIAILGTKMRERPTIHVNIGRARALLNAATDTVYAAMAETDVRIAGGFSPDEQDYFRQCAAGMQAVMLCDEVMKLILRVLGGNGLREGTAFERRYRDFQAMPLHINGHIDRITEQFGRLSLGLETQNPI